MSIDKTFSGGGELIGFAGTMTIAAGRQTLI
jgi:hypothetical protein